MAATARKYEIGIRLL